MSDDVLAASYSDDLPRMLRALEQPADPIARHFIFQRIVEHAYKLRHENERMRELCEEVARKYLSEFKATAIELKSSFGGRIPLVPSFAYLSTVLVEKGCLDEAIEVCETASSFGAKDGTLSGFRGRAKRIRNQQKAYAEGRANHTVRRGPPARPPEDVRAENSSVPRLKRYSPTVADMDSNQRRFYDRWCRAWESGAALPVDGNISYLFCYAYSVLERGPSTALDRLNSLIVAYRDSEPHFANFCRSWVSDCYVALEKYREALDRFPPPNIDSRSASATDSLLSLKLQVGEQISGRDILTLNGPRVTAWGRHHVNTLSDYLTILVQAYERERGSVNSCGNCVGHP